MERDEFLEEVMTVSVNAEVTVGGESWDGVATVRDGGAGEVEGVVILIEGEFDDVGIGDEVGVGDWTACRDHGKVKIFPEGAGEGINESGLEEGLVALDVDNVGGVLAGGGGFGNAVGAGGVIAAGEGEGGVNFLAEIGDTLVIGCDEEFVEFLALASAFEDVLEKGFSEEWMEGLSGEACRGPARWDNAYYSCARLLNQDPA